MSRACLLGQRLNLAAKASGNPLIEYLRSDGIQNSPLIKTLKLLFTAIRGNTGFRHCLAAATLRASLSTIQ